MPEFPASTPDLAGTTDPRELNRDARLGEKGWDLYYHRHYDGLQRTQLVRQRNGADRGWADDEHSKIPEMVDATADTDHARENEGLVTVDQRRYVVDPLAGTHTFKGLWTGGPVEVLTQNGHKVLRQTLTKTYCAGHGFTVAEDGSYEFSTSSRSRGYATVRNALLSHRSTIKHIFSSRMAFRSDIPGMYRTEIVWRDFTHESMEFILSEQGKKQAISAAEERYSLESGSVQEVHCDIDPETNTVVVIVGAIFKALNEPASVGDLLAMPCVEGPCSRETLRAFGWNGDNNGEGYEFIHQFKWFDIKDTPRTRKFLEFGVHDKDVLPRLLASEYASDNPRLIPGVADTKNGRYVYGTGDNTRMWWRIILERAAVEDGDDGTLSFVIVAAKPRWFGTGNEKIDAAVENPDGYGKSKRTVITSVDRMAAKRVAENATADAGFIRSSVSRAENDKGREDITVTQDKVWSWQNGDVPPNSVSIDGLKATGQRRTQTVRKESWDATFDRVDSNAVAALVASASAWMTGGGTQGRVTVKGVSQNPGGSYTVTLHAEGVSKKEFTEWLQTGSYFSEHYRRLRFNVPESDLDPGGLDPNTHEIFQSDRSLNDDGTWDETRTRVKPSAPRHLRFKAKSKPHGRAIDHDWFRNETALPQGLVDGSVSGSASYNEHGLLDGQTTEIDEEDDKSRSASEDHFHKETSVRSTDGDSRIDEAGVADGVITSVQETENGDGTFTHTVSRDEAKKCSHIRYVTTTGDQHHRRVVHHHVYRNAPGMAQELTAEADGTKRVEGSDQHNRYGLHDGSVSTYDSKMEDDKGDSLAEDHFTRTDGNTRVLDTSRLGDAGLKADHSLVQVSETTYPDGAIRSAKSTETPKEECRVHYMTKGGDRHHPRLVRHTAFVNARSEPDELKGLVKEGNDRIEGSFRHNKFNLTDGQFAKWDADTQDDVHETKVEDRYHVATSKTGTGDDAPTPSEYVAGTVASRQIVDYPDGEKQVTATSDRGKPASWEYSYDQHGRDPSDRTTVKVWRNWDTENPPIEAPDDDHSLGVSKTLNRYGLWDITATYSPKSSKRRKKIKNEQEDVTSQRKKWGIMYTNGRVPASFGTAGGAPVIPPFAPWSRAGYWRPYVYITRSLITADYIKALKFSETGTKDGHEDTVGGIRIGQNNIVFKVGVVNRFHEGNGVFHVVVTSTKIEGRFWYHNTVPDGLLTGVGAVAWL